MEGRLSRGIEVTSAELCERATLKVKCAVGSREAIQPTCVILNDGFDFRVGDVVEHFSDYLAAVGPEGIRMRVVALPGDVVQPDAMAIVDTVLVCDEAARDGFFTMVWVHYY